MQLRGTIIEDTFAEAFRMWAARLIVTAIDPHWASVAAREVTGYAASVIGCDAEAGVERILQPHETPDGRPGVSLLFFAFDAKRLGKAVLNRTGQCLMTCPTTAVFDGMPGVTNTDDSARCELASKLRFFGDGNQKSKLLDGRRYWRVPVMDGEFLCEESFGAVKAIGGGNLLICGPDQRTTLAATQRAVDAISTHREVIAPFPGGIVRSGSKVGSIYKALFASTNDEYCPHLRTKGKSKLRDGVNSVYEIVINGLSANAIAAATRAGIEAAAGEGTIAISAGNYGGNLGKFHFKLHEIMQAPADAKPVATTAAPTQPGGYTLTWRGKLAPIDGGFLRPDLLGGLDIDALRNTVVRIGKREAKLAEQFNIAGSPGDTLTVRNLPPLDGIGAGMRGGTLVIEGDAGNDLGASMKGGVIRVTGSAGDRVGGPAVGSDRGMTGGEIFIDGSAGRHVGYYMRRGLIAVRGDAGPSAGYRMLAGTIIIGGSAADHPALEARRGTVLLLGDATAATLGEHLQHQGTFAIDTVAALGLLLQKLQQSGWRIDAKQMQCNVALHSGDRFELGKGEVWQWLS
jgi:formylmethanofuran--tetrahydromethanopterin N-formyltransferase